MSHPSPSGRYRFGRFELQPDERRLLAEGVPVRLGSHAFDLLTALVTRGGSLVSKDELLERVWPRVVVEENTLQALVSALRKALDPNMIATVSGHGYRFTAPVTHIAPAPPAAPPLAVRYALPQPLTAFIGREAEIAVLTAMLQSTRLLVLTGAGGCGKTRLALFLASEQAKNFAAGVRLVELASLADPEWVPQALAGALGLAEQPGRSLAQTIGEHVGAQDLLIVLDNAEHLIDACARLVEALLHACPRLVVLVTSRERLGVAGELTYRVPSLAVPDEASQASLERVQACESVRLFVDRARLHRPDFAPAAGNVAALATVCRRLDGIPLAIELAAPRLRAMTLDELSQRLDQRFSLLTSGSRTAVPRQRTLRSMIDWSHDLLSSVEQTALRRLSVFSGGWFLAGAEHVCVGDGIDADNVLELLTVLVDKSLIVVTSERQGITRYGMLETMHHYARDRLEESGEAAAMRGRHLHFFVALAERVAPQLPGPDRLACIEQLESEHDNVRAALVWSCAGAPEAAGPACRLAVAMVMFWIARAYFREARAWFARLLAGEAGPLDDAGRAAGLRGAGILAMRQGDLEGARVRFEEGLALHRRLGDRLGISRALNNLGSVAANLGEYAAALPLHEESLALRRELGDEAGVAIVLSNLGLVATESGDRQAARAYYEEALAIQRRIGNPHMVAVLTNNLGSDARDQGDLAYAGALLEEALVLWHGAGDRPEIAEALESFAGLAVVLEQPMAAARLWGQSERLREEVGLAMVPRALGVHAREVARARASLDELAAFDLAWREGRAMALEQAIALAHDLAATARARPSPPAGT